jgi:hypothetical protein
VNWKRAKVQLLIRFAINTLRMSPALHFMGKKMKLFIAIVMQMRHKKHENCVMMKRTYNAQNVRESHCATWTRSDVEINASGARDCNVSIQLFLLMRLSAFPSAMLVLMVMAISLEIVLVQSKDQKLVEFLTKAV